MVAEAVECVHKHLSDLNDLQAARELFADLNYEPVYSLPLSRRSWNDETQRALVEDPEVIARHGEFRVIYSRLAAEQLRRGDERRVVERLLPDHRYALFIFSNEDASAWRFINVKPDDGPERRRVLRRFTVGPDERFGNRLRTISTQLGKVALDDDELDRLERAPLEIQRRYDEAFDVEAVTKAFYREYRRVFEAVEASITGFGDDTDRRRLFTQRLFNRLMFLAFVQRKGWLRLPGQVGNDYLSALWRAYVADRDAGHAASFYEDRLKLLFFAGLNNQHGTDDRASRERSVIERFIGDVPYLNGGLFDQDEDDRRTDIVVPDDGMHAILRDLFDRFNFTVTESTPLDVEVAVDPEMLGKVFEELVTGRHESGSYYTPKPIVSFMCREALKNYLERALPFEMPAAVERFVDEHDPAGLRDPEAVLEALKRVRSCDPACGSGAYLLGMLHELLDLRACLFAARKLDPITTYRRKLEIIEQNLYGVDIDPFAVNIAHLRLWLSLAVDYEGSKPEPLPNLDFKIERGDSILSPDPSTPTAPGKGRAQFLIPPDLKERLVRLKGEYLTAHSDQKRRLRAEINEAEAELEALTQIYVGRDALNWPIKFVEVMDEGGFDVALANPPYVRQELIKDIKPRLKDFYGPLYRGTADLLVYFYYRALQLLKPGGTLAFISSNKWLRADYGKKLRAHLAQVASVRDITDFGDLPVFEGATAYPMILIAQKVAAGGRVGQTRYTEVPSLDPPYPDIRTLIAKHGFDLPDDALSGEDWLLADAAASNRIELMQSAGTTLSDYVKGQIYYGIKTGFNKAFVIDGKKRAELIAADPKSAEIIKPFIVGKDIARWRIADRDRWLIFTRRGINIDDYPAIRDHLKRWKVDLTPKTRDAPRDAPGRKPGSYRWYEIQDAVDYYEAFERPKIVYPDISKELRFTYDTSGAYLANTSYFIASDDLFLLGVLNSEPLLELYLSTNAMVRGGYLRFFGQYIERLPIPIGSAADRAAIADLAQRCVDARGQGPEVTEWEAEINARVARLYGLTDEE